jgi:hypothetical protein
MSWNYSLFAVNMVFIPIVSATMFDKTTIILIKILNKLCSFHLLFWSGDYNLLLIKHFTLWRILFS